MFFQFTDLAFQNVPMAHQVAGFLQVYIPALVIKETNRGRNDIPLEHLEDEGIEGCQGKADDDRKDKDQQPKADQLVGVLKFLERCGDIQAGIEYHDACNHQRQGRNHGGNKEIAAQLFEVARKGVHRYAYRSRLIALDQGFSGKDFRELWFGCRTVW